MKYFPASDINTLFLSKLEAALRTRLGTSVPVTSGEFRQVHRPPHVYVSAEDGEVHDSGVSTLDVAVMLLMPDNVVKTSRRNIEQEVWEFLANPCIDPTAHPICETLSDVDLYVTGIGMIDPGEGYFEESKFLAKSWKFTVDAVKIRPGS